MLVTALLVILFSGSALAAETTKETKQDKRGIPESGGWIGIPNPHSYGHGQPWIGGPSWKEFKLPPFDLGHHGLYGGFPYGRGPAIPLPLGKLDLLKTLPVYITKHVVLEKPVPVPEPVYIEKPYHVPVEKVIPIPVEKIIHKPIPVPFPVPEAVPVPVKHPVAIPVHQPYPVPVKQAFPVPVPVPVPIPIPPPIPPPISLYGPAPLAHDYYARGYGPGHFYHGPGLPGHLLHSFDPHHGFGHGFNHDFGHSHGYSYPPVQYIHDYGHGHAHKKRSKS